MENQTSISILSNITETIVNSSTNITYTHISKQWKINLYKTVIPVMLTMCAVTIVFNITILSSMKWIRKRSISPTLCLSVSLAVADAYSSLVIGLGLLINSLLPYGYDIHLGSPCTTMVLEAFRLSGPIISVLHLLALAINHYIGILRPLHYASMVTKGRILMIIAIIWVLPYLYIFLYFSSISEQGFQSLNCTGFQFLLSHTFRLAFSVVFFVPLFGMAFIYWHIFMIVRTHHDIAGRYQNQMKKNVKAIVTTLLILGTYIVGWMPAVVIYVLFCTNCLYLQTIIPQRVFIVINIIINSLIILKSLIDSMVYTIRNQEIHKALIKMKQSFFCQDGDYSAGQNSFYWKTQRKSSANITNYAQNDSKNYQQKVKTGTKTARSNSFV